MPLSFASIRPQRYYNISPLLVKNVCLLLTYIKSVYQRACGKGKKVVTFTYQSSVFARLREQISGYRLSQYPTTPLPRASIALQRELN